jgi:hypothetical protein
MPVLRLRYRRAAFVPMMAMLGFALLFLNAFFALTVFKDLVTIVAAALASAALFLVLGLSPLLTGHSVDDKGIELRQGWYFRARIPISNIRGLEMVDMGPMRTGVYFRLTKDSLYVTTQRRDLFLLHLRQPQRFGFALGKRAGKVYFDTVDRTPFLRHMGQRGITPSSPGPRS